jgi:hypothetical protein
MDQLIQRKIGIIQQAVATRIFESIPLDDCDLCELYLENQFFEECYEIWDEVAEEMELVAADVLMRQGADTFYIGVISLFSAVPNWYEALPVFIAELLENIFEKEEWYIVFDQLNDPSTV